MGKLTGNLEEIAEKIRKLLTERDNAREKVLPLSREIIHNCSLAIRAIHRQEFSQASEMLSNAANLLNQAKNVTEGFDMLTSAGYLRDAEKEFVEASTLFAMVCKKPLPDYIELNVDPSAYLNGLGEAVGELRRYLLDGLRNGDLSRAEELLEAMDDIYCVLVTMDFPDAITNGLRRTTDNVRGILEKTRSDLTLITQQKKLETRLDSFEKQINKTS